MVTICTDRAYSTAARRGGTAAAGGSVRIRERYLSDAGLVVPVAQTLLGSTTASSSTSNKPQSPTVYLLPDSASLRTYLELFERPDFTGLAHDDSQTVAMLLLHSVLEDAAWDMTQKQRGRLQAVLRAQHNALIFYNDYCAETYVKAGGIAAVSKAATWCSQQIHTNSQNRQQQQPPVLVVMTDDPAALQLQSATATAAAAVVRVLDCEQYIDTYCNAQHAAALHSLRQQLHKAALAQTDNAAKQTIADSSGIALQQDAATIIAGLKHGIYLQGRLQIFKHNPREGTVSAKPVKSTSSTGTGQQSILISGRTSLNCAIDNDIVAVQLLPRDKWRKPESSRKLTVSAQTRADDDVNDSNDENSDTTAASGTVPTGVIVGIIQMRRRPYVATIPPEEASRSGESGVLATPMDVRIPKVSTHVTVIINVQVLCYELS
jgi:Rrp44-like cold shock domain